MQNTDNHIITKIYDKNAGNNGTNGTFETFETFETSGTNSVHPDCDDAPFDLAPITHGIQPFSDKPDAADLPPLLRHPFESQGEAAARDKMLLGTLWHRERPAASLYGICDRRKVYPPFYKISIFIF